MNLQMDPGVAAGYTAKSQIARRITESWAVNNLYCPFCGNPGLQKFPNNRPVADFFCTACGAEFELKSAKHRLRSKINGSEYEALIRRLRAENSPHFLFLAYDAAWQVQQLYLVPRYCMTEALIERRSPLRPSARRSGWVGSNILWKAIPEEHRIPLVRDGMQHDPEEVYRMLQDMGFAAGGNRPLTGWQKDVLDCIGRIATDEFSLQDVYAYEEQLAQKYPQNRHVRDKIRQILQVLRDRGFIEFLGDGMYRKKTAL